MDDHVGVVGHGAGKEGVAPHHGVLADDGLAAQDRRAGVDGHVVADGGVPLARQAGVARPRRQRAQRHALVQLDVAADDGGLADDDAAAVVDEDPMSQDRARMDLDPGLSYRPLRYPSGKKIMFLQIELMCDSVMKNCFETRIQEYFHIRLDRRIPFPYYLNFFIDI